MINIVVILILLGLGYFTGQYFEKKHYKSIIDREKSLIHIPVITGGRKGPFDSGEEGVLFGDGIVVGSDYFKTFVSGLRGLVGGRMISYETLLDRGRREAILRLKEKSQRWGAHKIVNLRLETATLGRTSSGKGHLPCVEVYAYATAIRKTKS